MSGFLPDLASWALRGGAGNNTDERNDENGETLASNEPVLTPEEMRAQRLARMEALQKEQQEEQQKKEQEAPQPMDIDSPEKPEASAKPAQAAVPVASPEPAAEQKKKKPKPTDTSPGDAVGKMQRKKELLTKKVLMITLSGNTSDSSCVPVDIDSQDITVQTIAEILATRLSLPSDSHALQTTPAQKPLIAYLGDCHRRASEELKSLQQSSKYIPGEFSEILEEIQRQVVSYAASCLLEPDLFEMGKDATIQLAKCLVTLDITSSITFGVNGPSSSFYYQVIEELVQQDVDALPKIVDEIVDYYVSQIKKCESVLDSADGDVGAAVYVAALTALCVHKKVAETVTKLQSFLLPAEGTMEAAQVIRPEIPTGRNILELFARSSPPYKRRSGPGLEKDTLLGVILRVGIPRNNPAFPPTSILRQSLNAVESVTSSQRQQLRVHQQACNQFVISLLKAGADARKAVMQWFIDALLVNVAASGMRPDPSKVSSSNLLLNMSVVLLKLCEPFVNDPKKQLLIDPGFVSSLADHGGVFQTTGENSVPRLGEVEQNGTQDTYNPKNSFIPQCFFFCARSLHFGISPLLSQNESLLRHISHLHYDITTHNRDLQSDPNFSMLVSRQRSNEVAVFEEEMVKDTLVFCNLLAKFLYELDDVVLKTMPEDFVNDACDIVMSIAKMKPKLLRGMEFGYIFKLVVKLLSSKYAEMVRNYNLRAMLGDILYELFLPTASGDRREIPSSVYCDPSAGSQPFLLSDTTAQETLAPSLLLLYGEVEQTGYYDKMSHRAKIVSVIKFLWESSEHRPAFRRITQNKESFIKFANGIMNETNQLISTVMQKLPEIRGTQLRMRNPQEWSQLSEEEQTQISSRLEDNEREVRHALPLCNKTLQMFGYLNTDNDIRNLFLLEELCPRLVNMLLHVLTKLVGSKGLELKVDNPEQYDFRPKEMLRDLCAIFALFAPSETFQLECAKNQCDPSLLRSAIKTCKKLNLLTGESMDAFEELPGLVEAASKMVAADEELLADAPDEFLDEILSTYMKDPVILPSGHYVDRSTITQHLLNDPIDPFNREPMTVDDIKPATELKEKMNKWLEEKRAAIKM